MVMAIENGYENGIRTMALSDMLEENPLGGFRQGPRGPRGSRGFQGSQAWDNILSKMFPNSSSLRTWDMDSPDSKD